MKLCHNVTDKQSFLFLHCVKYLRNLTSVQNKSDMRHIVDYGLGERVNIVDSVCAQTHLWGSGLCQWMENCDRTWYVEQ